MLGVNQRRRAALPLHLGDGVQRKCGLPAALGAVHLQQRGLSQVAPSVYHPSAAVHGRSPALGCIAGHSLHITAYKTRQGI